MIESIVIGSGFALAAAVMPGPLQAFLLTTAARKGWKRTLPACLAPLISDGPIAILVLLLLGRVPEAMTRVLQAAGGLFLLYLAWAGFRQWRQWIATGPETGESTPHTLAQAVVVNLLNPNVYISWSLVLGPAFMNAWHTGAVHAAALIIAFYATMVAALACTVLLFGTTHLLGPAGRRSLILVSVIALAALGVYQLIGSFI